MRIHATINERTVRRTFRDQKFGRTGLTVIDKDLPAFGLKVPKNGTKTFFVRVARRLGADNIALGTADEITAEEAREKVAAAIAADSILFNVGRLAVQGIGLLVQLDGFIVGNLDRLWPGNLNVGDEPLLFSPGHPRESLRVVHQAMQHGPRDTILRPARKHYKLMSVTRKRGLDGFFECGLSGHVLPPLMVWCVSPSQRTKGKPQTGEGGKSEPGAAGSGTRRVNASDRRRRRGGRSGASGALGTRTRR